MYPRPKFLNSKISSIAINFLEQEFLHSNEVGIAFIYFDYKTKITLDDIIGSLLKHLVQQKGTYITRTGRNVLNAYGKGNTSHTLRTDEANSCKRPGY